jgi:predicted RNase H-like HicB family nuclease
VEKHPDKALVVTVPGNEGKELGHAERYAQEGGAEMRRYPVVIERTGTGYSAYSPDVAGCAAAGDTKEETRRNFQDALVAHFDAMREVGEPIPEPHTSVDYVEVAA